MTPGSGRVPRVALITYTTKPRGGAVHTLHLAEALHAAGQPVHVFALGDPHAGFFRPLRAPATIFPAPEPAGTLTERVFAAADALVVGLAAAVPGRFDLLHVQDCIAARAALAIGHGADGAVLPVVRTVHHVDDFTTEALIECQLRSILDPDHLLVVSRHWQRRLADEYGVAADVVTNGVDAARFATAGAADPQRLRARIGAGDAFLFLTVGGIEPRKGTSDLFEALALLRDAGNPHVKLAVVGGHSFQDHSAYREAALGRARELGLELDRDIVVLGTVPDAELPAWYRAADAFAFPSVKEGWGIVVLEAMAAGLPVVTSDIAVFREYLVDGENALLAAAGEPAALAGALGRVIGDGALRARLRVAGRRTADAFTWSRSAQRHIDFYRHLEG